MYIKSRFLESLYIKSTLKVYKYKINIPKNPTIIIITQ